MKELKNILLISGSGRNCGKTTVACHAISQLAESGQVYGLKITPHFHLTANNQHIVAEGDGYRIFRETDTQSGKDSARMLNAGAAEVYFIQCGDGDLHKVYQHIKLLIPENKAIVCESGSLANIYLPGMHILIEGTEVDLSKKSYLKNRKRADILLSQADFSPSNLQHHVRYSESKWKFQKEDLNPVRKTA